MCVKRVVQPTELLQPVQHPVLPWNNVGADLMDLNSAAYLIIVDYFSHYINVIPLTNTISLTIVKHLHCVCATHDYPATMATGNGLKFSSEAFATFYTTNGQEPLT